MNEINNAEKIFLGKLEVFLQTFDTLDRIGKEIQELIDNEPEKQRQLDLLLSDYYHMLENDDLSDTEILNIGKKIHDTRVLRRDENRVSTIIACYEQHKNKLQYSVKSNRDFFRQAITNRCKNLHEDYKYRVLTEDDIKGFKKEDKVEKKEKRQRRKGISKEELQDCLNKGMKTKDIANKYSVFATYVSNMKKKYGLNKKV